MTINILSATKAYLSVIDIMNSKTDFQTAHALLMAKRSLQPHAEFYISKERCIIETYADRDDCGKLIVTDTGEYSFTPEKFDGYKTEKSELDSLDVDVDLERKTIKPVDLTASQLESIMEIFDFAEV